MEDEVKTLGIVAGVGAALGLGVALGLGLRVLAWGAALGLGAGAAVALSTVARRRGGPAGLLEDHTAAAVH